MELINLANRIASVILIIALIGFSFLWFRPGPISIFMDKAKQGNNLEWKGFELQTASDLLGVETPDGEFLAIYQLSNFNTSYENARSLGVSIYEDGTYEAFFKFCLENESRCRISETAGLAQKVKEFITNGDGETSYSSTFMSIDCPLVIMYNGDVLMPESMKKVVHELYTTGVCSD